MEERILLLVLILACAVLEDLYAYRISNVLIITGLVSGLGRQILLYGYIGVKEGIFGMLLPAALLFPVFCLRGIGAGDIKLLGVVGSYLSYHASFSILAVSVLIGGIYALIQIIKGKRREKLHMSVPIMLSTLLWLEGLI
ncbi:MAG: prepilin peptidase [Clostridiales bacterium]|nr:prepilin peptidase [Clostridiales bacterium]